MSNFKNCDTCEYFDYMVDKFGDIMQDKTLQKMTARQTQHLQFTHGVKL